MILFIDNYDSFTYNLVQLAGAVDSDIRVVRNDAITVEEIRALNPSHIIISPGPGYPKDAGISEAVLRTFSREGIPVLGVCLGHQALCEVEGATIAHAGKLMHGKQSDITIVTDCPLFRGLSQTIKAARYHSLIAVNDTLTDTLRVIATDQEHQIMGGHLTGTQTYGLQFHPESILTPLGHVIMENFLSL